MMQVQAFWSQVAALPQSDVAGHVHTWERFPETVGLFSCAARRCLWFAVCPGCLRSLDVALRVRNGIEGMALCWCPAHYGGGNDAD